VDERLSNVSGVHLVQCSTVAVPQDPHAILQSGTALLFAHAGAPLVECRAHQRERQVPAISTKQSNFRIYVVTSYTVVVTRARQGRWAPSRDHIILKLSCDEVDSPQVALTVGKASDHKRVPQRIAFGATVVHDT
jgi:hypothetical protein